MQTAARILGELKKFGIGTVSKTTVANILREAGLDPGPKRGEGTWSDFVARHAATLWASDFLSIRSLTARGWTELYVLFFIQVGTRRVFVAGVTEHPDAVWVTQRTVKKDNTFSFQSRRYETPADLRGHQIQLRHDRPDSDTGVSSTVIIYHKGQRIGPARLLDSVANGLRRRKEQL